MSFLFILILGLCQTNTPLNATTKAVDDSRLQKLVRSSGIASSDLGIYITSTDQVYYENQSQKKFVPASLSKLLTAIAALKSFPPEERVKTELRTTSPIQDGKLDGALYIKGYGDPSFISENLWVLVNHFTRKNIKSIKGPIYVDSTIFDNKFFDESRQSLRVDRAYDSPVSGLSFNWNTVNVYVQPGSRAGDPLKIFLDPANEYFTLVNKTKTISGSQPAAIAIDKESIPNGEKIIVSGSMGINQSEIVKYASVTNPDLWVGKNLVSFLNQRGIEVVDKNIIAKKTPEDAKILSEAFGWTHFEVIDGMLKFSNNFLAEMLTKEIAVKAGSRPGSVEKGVEQVRNLLQAEYKLQKDKYEFTSPSGFSSKNKMSPKDLGDLLNNAQKDFAISSYLLSALAIPQSEGTLSKRMKNLKEPRMVRAKTGLLSGATGLAGYAMNTKGEVLTFVFIYNGSGRESEARDLFDGMASELTKL